MVEEGQWREEAEAMLPMMWQLAGSILRSRQDAEDAVQQALMRAWETRARARAATFRGYLMRILVNECRNIQRQRQRVTPMEDFSLIPAPERDDMREVYRAISALPESLRLPLCLKYLEDLSEKEAAQALGLTVTTFKSRLHRARKLLRKSLDREVTLE